MSLTENELLKSLSIPLGAVAALAKLPQQKLSAYFADADRVRADERDKIRAAIQQAIELENNVRAELETMLSETLSRALSINWKNPAAVRALIQHLHGGEVRE